MAAKAKKLTVKSYRVLWEKQIHVHLKPRQPGEVFQAGCDDEIKILVKQKYLEEVAHA